jgi:hypothetical protein
LEEQAQGGPYSWLHDTDEKRRLIRPVTARYMHAKEIEAYEKESAPPENR